MSDNSTKSTILCAYSDGATFSLRAVNNGSIEVADTAKTSTSATMVFISNNKIYSVFQSKRYKIIDLSQLLKLLVFHQFIVNPIESNDII
jgi:hypothetical protein